MLTSRTVAAVVAGLVVLAGLAAGSVALLTKEPGHNPLHIGCKDHNHGPKWFARHGKAVWRGEPATDEAADDPVPMTRRAIPSGR